ncbi:toll/interleukin-1 receptor domain-containing protein, partial [Nocardia farcinica]|uniref:toll/interleukin-1 receptor domain-containing protein n=2 Tax=Nocardia TaxID=1817 RepID=UPI002456F741
MRTGQASTEQASTGAAITPEAPRPSSACYEYDAFISYAHADRPIAAGIQKGLHRIGRRVGRLHALRVFRDATDLTASPDLWGRVSDAMDRARYLIVVLSPHSARSGWVNKEVGHWLRERGPDRLLFVLADGHLTWDETARRLDPGHSDVALPVLTEPGSLPTEPFYVDVTEDAPWDPAAPLFREKVTDLAAPIHGKPKYELAGEDLRELRKFRRFRRGVLAGLAVLTVVAVAAAFLAVAKQREAERQRNEAIALRLVADGQALLSGARPGSDARALKQILAARSIGSSPDDGALLWALLAQPELLKIVEVPAPDIATAMLSPDGQRVVTGGKDGTVRLWDAGTGRAIGDPIAAHDGLVSAEFTRDGQRIASAGWDDRTARVWDAVDGTPIGVPIPLPAGDMKIAEVSPDGRRIAVATSAEQVGRTGAVRVWDVQTGTPVAASAIHVDGFVLDVAFAPDGQRIAVSVGAPPEGEVRIWDVTTGAPVGDPMGGGDAGMTITAAFSPDGRRVAAGGEDGAVRIWDIETFQELGAPLTGHEGAVASVAFSPDGRRLVTGGADRTVRAWDIESRRQIGDPMTGHQGWVEHVAFTADGAGIASASGSEGVVRVWNIDVGAANHDGVTSVAFAPDVPYFASGGTDGSLKIWSVDGERYGEPMI